MRSGTTRCGCWRCGSRRSATTTSFASQVADAAERARESFNKRFWSDDLGYLYDVVDGEHGDSTTLSPEPDIRDLARPSRARSLRAGKRCSTSCRSGCSHQSVCDRLRRAIPTTRSGTSAICARETPRIIRARCGRGSSVRGSMLGSRSTRRHGMARVSSSMDASPRSANSASARSARCSMRRSHIRREGVSHRRGALPKCCGVGEDGGAAEPAAASSQHWPKRPSAHRRVTERKREMTKSPRDIAWALRHSLSSAGLDYGFSFLSRRMSRRSGGRPAIGVLGRSWCTSRRALASSCVHLGDPDAGRAFFCDFVVSPLAARLAQLALVLPDIARDRPTRRACHRDGRRAVMSRHRAVLTQVTLLSRRTSRQLAAFCSYGRAAASPAYRLAWRFERPTLEPASITSAMVTIADETFRISILLHVRRRPSSPR